MITKLNIEGTPIRVQEARRMLTNWNKLVREETIKGVYRMKASDISNVLKDFTIKNGVVKHKTKAKGWSFNPETLEAKTGKVITKIPKYTPYKIIKPPKKEKMPTPAVKKEKMTKEEKKDITKKLRKENAKRKKEAKNMINAPNKDTKNEGEPVDLSKDKIKTMVKKKRVYKKKKGVKLQ